MSKQANKTVIGVFVVVAIALAVVAIIVLGSGKFFQRIDKRVIFFEGSVRGLNVGSPVMFRGVKIGEVHDISLYFEKEKVNFKIPVIISLYPDKIKNMAEEKTFKSKKDLLYDLIKRGLRAQLQSVSMVTGQLFIQLDFFPDRPAVFVGAARLGLDENIPELPAIPSTIQTILKKIENLPIQEIVDDLRNALAGLNRIVNSPETDKTIHYLKQTMKEVRDLVRHIDEKIDPLAKDFTKTSASTRAALDQTRRLVKNIDDRVEPLAAELTGTLSATRSAVQQTQKTLAALQEATEEGSPLRYEISNALKELSGAARSIRVFADYLEKNPDALLRGKVKPGGK